MNNKPTLYLISGMNAAGKSTYGYILQKEKEITFINPDAVAKEILGHYPNEQDTFAELNKATHEIGVRYKKALELKKDFIFEQIVPKPAIIQEAREHNFDISLIYIGVDNIQNSKIRVDKRLKDGGISISFGNVIQNFRNSLKKLSKVKFKVDELVLFDNSKKSESFEPILTIKNNQVCYQSHSIPEWSKNIVTAINKNTSVRSDKMPEVKEVKKAIEPEVSKKPKVSTAMSNKMKNIDISAERDIAATKSLINFIALLLQKLKKGKEDKNDEIDEKTIKRSLIALIKDKNKQGKEILNKFFSEDKTKEMFDEAFGKENGEQAMKVTKECLEKDKEIDIAQIAKMNDVKLPELSENENQQVGKKVKKQTQRAK